MRGLGSGAGADTGANWVGSVAATDATGGGATGLLGISNLRAPSTTVLARNPTELTLWSKLLNANADRRSAAASSALLAMTTESSLRNCATQDAPCERVSPAAFCCTVFENLASVPTSPTVGRVFAGLLPGRSDGAFRDP
jgi:hypothetical protein